MSRDAKKHSATESGIRKKNLKKYEDLTIVDDFMFGKVFRNPDRCKKLLQLILGVKIRHIEFLDTQEVFEPTYGAKGIRLDVYVEDDNDMVYNVEMQTNDVDNLPKRSRYYQSVIDINIIEKGSSYNALKKNFVIFICTFDLFGKGRHIYRFENICKEDKEIYLGDGTEKIFLNTRGVMDDVDKDLKNFLTYLESKMPQDEYTKELDDAVDSAKHNPEWEREYMKYYLDLQDAREEGRAEGKEDKLVDQIKKKLEKGKQISTISDEVEEAEDYVKELIEKYKLNK